MSRNNEVINARVCWRNDITENSATACLLKAHTFFLINMWEKSNWKQFMDWLLKDKITKNKRENTIYLWSAVYQQTNE